MTFKKSASALACALIIALLASFSPALAQPENVDAELERALELGIVDTLPSGDALDATVTYSEFFAMLDEAVELMCPEALTYWQTGWLTTQEAGQYVDLRYSRTADTMKRTDGVMAVFLAAWAMGGKYLTFNGDWKALLGDHWPDAWPDPNKFLGIGNIKCDVTKEAITPDPQNETWNGNNCAYVYALGRISAFSGKLMFDYDTTSGTLLPGDDLTYADAARAVVRFYDSFLEIRTAEGWPGAAEARLIQQAEARKQAILGSTAEIAEDERADEYVQGATYCGTAYYVSSSEGNDGNDGSMEAPFKTLMRVDCRDKTDGGANNDGFLQPGDAVFLMRGDSWREVLYCDEYVTYSAYGTGAKPKILGSPENGAGEEKWLPYYSDESGKKIWLYSEPIPDCGCVVFNGGESYASRVFSWFDYDASETTGNDVVVYPYDKERPFVIAEALDKDLTFYSTFTDKYGKAPVGYQPKSNSYWVTDMDSSGPLYLRCDAGDPGDIYDSIEFQSRAPGAQAYGYTGLVRCAEGCTVDNLCVLYHSTTGIDRNAFNNILIQNCEVGWIGGTEFSLNYIAPVGDKNIPVVTAGEAVRLEGRNNRIISSYIHDSFDGAVTMEFDYEYAGVITPPDGNGGGTFENMSVLNNVIENSGNGIVIGDHNFHNREDERKICGGITISGNYVLGSGYGWSGHDNYDTWISLSRDKNYAGHAVTLWDGPSYNNGITITNNYFLTSRGSPVRMGTDEDNRPTFNRNTYAQTLGAPFFGTWAPWRGTVFTFPALDNAFAGQLCAAELRDGDATVILSPARPTVTEGADGSLSLQWPDRTGAPDGTLYLALYKGLKMTGIHSETVSAETESLSLEWPSPPEHDTVRLFMLSENQSPLFQSLTY